MKAHDDLLTCLAVPGCLFSLFLPSFLPSFIIYNHSFHQSETFIFSGSINRPWKFHVFLFFFLITLHLKRTNTDFFTLINSK